MADYRQNSYRSSRMATNVASGQVDQGLRSYMLRVYNIMALGVAVTAITTLFVASNPALLQGLTGGGSLLLFGGLLALGWFAPRLILNGSTAVAHLCYWGYAMLWGLLIAPMVIYFLASDPRIVGEALLITVIAFAGVSLVGYTTKRDLNLFSTFFVMASIGFIAAMLINYIFIGSGFFSVIISCGVVLLFSAITAWETQQIKKMYYSGNMGPNASRKAIFGAFILFGSFITLFIHILNILGYMRSN